ncbi:MAG: LamG domain-containing protein [Bacillota bacterium]
MKFKKGLFVSGLVIALMVAGVSGIEALAEEEPVAHFSFEENLQDETENFARGQIIGGLLGPEMGQVTEEVGEEYGDLSYAEGISGQGIKFDGKSGVLLPEDLITDNTYSVSLWVKPDAFTHHTPAFYGAVSGTEWISLVPGGISNIEETILWSGENWYDGNTGMLIEKEEWTHLAFTVDNGDVSVYVDGEEMHSGEEFPEIFSGSGTFALGVNWWDEPYVGMMDELRIYDTAISAEQISELAQE